MVLCKIDKYYNQVKFQFLWPRLKVGSSTVMFTGFKSPSSENMRKIYIFSFSHISVS